MSITWKVDSSKLLEPFRSDVDELLSIDKASWFVTYGFRTREVQAALYAKYEAGGPLAAPPGKSAHEFGLAVDVTLAENGKDIWDVKHPSWVRLISLIKAHPRLHSLASLGDYDHIEAVNWRALARAAAARQFAID